MLNQVVEPSERSDMASGPAADPGNNGCWSPCCMHANLPLAAACSYLQSDPHLAFSFAPPATASRR